MRKAWILYRGYEIPHVSKLRPWVFSVETLRGELKTRGVLEMHFKNRFSHRIGRSSADRSPSLPPCAVSFVLRTYHRLLGMAQYGKNIFGPCGCRSQGTVGWYSPETAWLEPLRPPRSASLPPHRLPLSCYSVAIYLVRDRLQKRYEQQSRSFRIYPRRKLSCRDVSYLSSAASKQQGWCVSRWLTHKPKREEVVTYDVFLYWSLSSTLYEQCSSSIIDDQRCM